MAIQMQVLADLAALASWMQANAVPKFFKAVTYDNSTITCTDDDDNTILEITAGSVTAYRSATSSVAMTDGYATLFGVNNITLISCANGFMFETEYASNAKKAAVLVAKTNNDKTAFIFSIPESNSLTTQYYTDIHHVAWGDNTTIETTTSFVPEAAQQTAIVKFATNANIGEVSNTRYAYYMPMNQNYASGIGKFVLNDDVYITNGYWAICDGNYSA